MKKIRNVTIVGAGAMGAAYAAMFSEAGDFDVFFAASGERCRRLRQSPLTVNGKHHEIPVVDTSKGSHPADLVLVALKHHHLRDAVADIKTLVGDDTIILSVMNGLESEEIIGSVCGMDKMVYAIAVGIDAVRQANSITYARPGKIIFGEHPTTGSPRLDRLGQALSRAGIPNEVPQDIMRAMWWKFMINVGTNQASAVLLAPYGMLLSSPDANALMTMLMQEVIDLARKIKIDLSQKDLHEWHDILATLSPAGKTSMLQDIEAGRKTEVDIFAGKMVAMGKEHGWPTPVNATVYHIIRYMEDNFGVRQTNASITE